jgi:hypothetical protein
MNAQASAFNPEMFLNITTIDANSTELLQVPEGEYTAVTQGIGPDSFKRFPIKQGERAGQDFYRLDVVWLINDEGKAIEQSIGRAPKVTQGIGLDISKDGTLEMGKGKNVGLGQLREALGQNAAGRPWSMSQLGGQVAKIQVKHRLDANSGRTYIDVTKVARA